ncbi:hypothetical protein VOLCADRAFT_97635 [Volvox carteri f. nagariensis]|uniref:Uncharacterized protein n=1 Tax=Volvox carteri f. nagariensis TaxID=3068 RepID=D8UD85_VOLCA|nr:uncharacterized protein VOLCADRAFT_97635 [Volvox carteri f. nagariensis]EFJ42349.1 hypothetical protein VOLCADRAFT_97635 [Volvox carteri f. nagariensis]|eukprot:XP_002956582.1 hypothetical protein VOLCADRAFT_97635 [Volvox carteri f. nagariensis]
MYGNFAAYAAASSGAQAAFGVPSLPQTHQQTQSEPWRIQPTAALAVHIPSAYDTSYPTPYLTALFHASPLRPRADPGAIYSPQHAAFGQLSGVPDGAGYVYQGVYGMTQHPEGGGPEGGSGYGDSDDSPGCGGGGGGTSMLYGRSTSSGSSVKSGYGGGGGGGSAAAAAGTRHRSQAQQPASAATAIAAAPAVAAAAAAAAARSQVGRVKEGALVSHSSVEQLAQSAPLWVVYYNYTVNGPVGHSGILTGDQLMQAYRNRRVHGHTLLVGLAAEARSLLSSSAAAAAVACCGGGGAAPSSSSSSLSSLRSPSPSAPSSGQGGGGGGGPVVPPSFLRPLVFYLALAQAGMPYTPITSDQLMAGLPPLGWCLPAPLLQPKVAADAADAAAAAGCSFGARGPAKQQPLARWAGPTVDTAVRQLLSRAPFWCLLNLYGESGRWNCHQNLTAAQLQERLPAGHSCLHACVLGTTERLPGGVWIPTSLVLPLGALLQAVTADGDGDGAPLQYIPQSAADVRYYIEDAIGAVLGRQEAAARLQAHLTHLAAATATAAVHRPPSSSCTKGLTLPNGQLDPSAAVFVPQCTVAAAGGGGSLPKRMGTAAGAKSECTAAAAAATAAAAAAKAKSGRTLPPDCTGAIPATGTAAEAKAEVEADMVQMPRPAPPTEKALEGDQGQHAFTSLWWYMDPLAPDGGSGGATVAAAGTARTLGPYSCEQMILAYIAQLLPHDALVCGTQSTLAPDSAPPPPPPQPSAFQPLDHLLVAAEEGHSYALLPAVAVTAAPERLTVLTQQQQHGPGICACCRPAMGSEPVVQYVTYVEGVVLEVEMADGDVVYFNQDAGDDENGGSSGDSLSGVAAATVVGSADSGGSGGGGSGGPLVFVPDLVIPPLPSLDSDFNSVSSAL